MAEAYDQLLYKAGFTQYYPLYYPGAKTFFVAPADYPGAVGGNGRGDGNDGSDPQHPLATIAAAHALCVSGRGDTICLLPGTHVLTATGAITKQAVRIVSLKPYAATVTGDGVITVGVTVNASDVEFAGLRLLGTAAALVQMIVLGNTVDIRNTHIHHCKFIGIETLASVEGIVNGENIAGTDALHTIIEYCEFEGLSESCITTYGGGAVIRHNHFNVDDTAGATAIIIGDQGAAFGAVKACFIHDNIFSGQTDNSALLAITFAGAEANSQMVAIARNFLCSLSGAITQDRHPESVVFNYVGGLTGGALVDPTVA